MARRPAILLLNMLLVASVLAVGSAASAVPPDDGAIATCERLAGANANAEVEVVGASPTLPEYCRVAGQLSGRIGFEVRMPTTTWNGKFYMTGCGGFCGNVNADACNAALARGYAIAASDGGHTASSGDGSWGYDDTRAEVDYAFLAVHRTAVHAKSLIRHHYGQGPSYSYFAGCSGGGREALMSAQTYPNDFDGIIAGAPANRQAYLAGVSQAWIEQAQFDSDGARVFTVADAQLVGQAVYAACDDVDGLADGVIDDPRNCDVEPADLACPSSDPCLDPEAVTALAKIWDSPRDSSGTALYPGGLPAGSEPLWPGFSVGFGDGLSGGGNFAQEYLRYLAFPRDPGLDYSLFDFDFDTDVKDLRPRANLYNATSDNLGGFEANGGKLILYHGWADPLITPYGTVAYYDDLVDNSGGLAATQEWARLFMFPGMGHCSGGPGPNQFDALTLLEDWVEDGQAPERIVATGGVVPDRTRPVFPYPAVARYDGSGSIDEADNFVPVTP